MTIALAAPAALWIRSCAAGAGAARRREPNSRYAPRILLLEAGFVYGLCATNTRCLFNIEGKGGLFKRDLTCKYSVFQDVIHFICIDDSFTGKNHVNVAPFDVVQIQLQDAIVARQWVFEM